MMEMSIKLTKADLQAIANGAEWRDMKQAWLSKYSSRLVDVRISCQEV